jgi:hypothetical protein
MGIYDELNRNPTRRDLVSFGLIVAAGMAAFAGWFHLHARPGRALVCLAVGGAVLVLSWIPPVGRRLYVLWMALGMTIGFFTAPIVMLAVYVLVVVPVGLWFKLVRRDVMRRKLDRQATSYWEDYPRSKDPASYVRQF